MLSNYDKLIFEVSEVGRTGYRLPELDVECNIEEVIASEYLTKEELNFPEVSEFDVVRHYTNLSSKTILLIKVFILLDLVR